MNAYPSSPPPDPSWWISIADHIEAIIVGVGTAALTAGAALWRAAIWTERMKNEIRINREESERRHRTILEKLENMQEANERQHESAKRELDQMRGDVLAIRNEQREVAQALSQRIDRVFVRGG